jgi:hypothetical protein
MNFRAGACVAPLVKGDAEVIECDAVDIKTLALRSENRNELWRKIQNLPKFLLALAECLC